MPRQEPDDLAKERGRRSEDVATWYFRLNGFLTIPSFIVHPDHVALHPRTEADLLGVRLPHSTEKIRGKVMTDDPLLLGCARSDKTLFVLVEVKASRCALNGPWTNAADRNMQRVIRRLGFAREEIIDDIATSFYEHLRWEDTRSVLQYVCVGKTDDSALAARYPHLRQITFAHIGRFLYQRFSDFPEKMPGGPISSIHEQWPDFGKLYASWFRSRFPPHLHRSRPADTVLQDPILTYIETGACLPDPR